MNEVLIPATIRDVSYTLSSPLTPLLTPKPSFWDLLVNRSISPSNEQEFYESFSKEVQDITFLFAELDRSKGMFKWFRSHLLINKIQGCLTNLFTWAPKHKISLQVAQKVFALAMDLKRHESRRSTIWNALLEKHREFIHRVTPWTEDLKVLNGSISYEWLGDGKMERVRHTTQAIADFGNGMLFKVGPCKTQQNQNWVFSLLQFPGYHLSTATSERQMSCPIPLLKGGTLNRTTGGRIAEVFDVQKLIEEINKGNEDSKLYFNRLLSLFSCYQAALYSALEIPVDLPSAIGRGGEWTIGQDAERKRDLKSSLSPTLLAELHHMFQIEKLWKINVFHENPILVTMKGHLMLDGLHPLPTFFTENVEQRHHAWIKKWSLDSNPQWAQLELSTKEQEEKISHQLDGIKVQLEQKELSLQDCLAPDAQTLSVPLDEPEFFQYRLLLLRGAMECFPGDRERINEALHSVLHDAMVKKYAAAFLAEMQQQLQI